MARMTPHLCSYPGCPEILVGGPGRCERHPYPRRSRKAGVATAGGYGDRAWARVSRAYRAEHPRCEAPGCREDSAIVHHIDGRRPDDPGANEWSNLAALCAAHHTQITRHPDAFALPTTID